MALNFTFHQPGWFPGFTHLPLVPTVQTGYISTTIYPQFYKQMIVEWSIPVEWGDCVFDVYKAEFQAGPWKKLTPSSTASNFVKDTETEAYSKFNTSWYIVECQLPDGRRIQGQPATWRNKRNDWVQLRGNEIQRRETFLLTRYTGVKTLLFRRKHFGKRCGNCWNFDNEVVTNDHCPICLGTSFEGGYYSPFETLLQYDILNARSNKQYQGVVESNTISAWTVSYPEIEAHDLVYRVPDAKMFIVEQISATELLTVPVRQILTLTELAKESIEFKLASSTIPAEYL